MAKSTERETYDPNNLKADFPALVTAMALFDNGTLYAYVTDSKAQTKIRNLSLVGRCDMRRLWRIAQRESVRSLCAVESDGKRMRKLTLEQLRTIAEGAALSLRNASERYEANKSRYQEGFKPSWLESAETYYNVSRRAYEAAQAEYDAKREDSHK